MHEPLRTEGRRSAAVLDRAEAVGADADPAWFPSDGLVHMDLHTDNILADDDGALTGIIDWEGASRPRSLRGLRDSGRRRRSTSARRWGGRWARPGIGRGPPQDERKGGFKDGPRGAR
jgi:hypothetical protein